jgi:phage terminase large subunit
VTFKSTRATKKLLKLKKRIRAVAGGTSASKTISILLILIDVAQNNKDLLISIVSESFPHLRKGAMRDFKNIMEGHGYWRDKLWNETNKLYSFPGGSVIEFFSADMPSKVRGPRRDILFINEANNVPYETYTQLEIRTKKTIWLDWNPVSEFWYYEEVRPNQEHDFITLTYKDNDALEESIITSIESRKGNKNWWKVYGLGELGDAEGRIYTGWQIIDEIPHEARLERYGLDFGYSNDPTAIVAVYRYNNSFILDEITHLKGLSNKQIADILMNQDKQALCIADSAEPKSIDEIISYGVSIIGSKKGQGSVNQGIQFVQDQQISMTKRSVNIIKSYRNYLWDTDKEGKILNTPNHMFSDALDAVRYAIASMRYSEEVDLPPDDSGLFTKDGLY